VGKSVPGLEVRRSRSFEILFDCWDGEGIEEERPDKEGDKGDLVDPGLGRPWDGRIIDCRKELDETITGFRVSLIVGHAGRDKTSKELMVGFTNGLDRLIIDFKFRVERAVGTGFRGMSFT
jgi:hypothetical protein